ncbi:phosphotriesterase [Peribacillus sp. YIM B13472]|uniref:phosphotriesterase family protein n=1 Tax=Peribacillus sp. YIM B13472 TaxID=3366297 RepID=UPI003670C4F6
MTLKESVYIQTVLGSVNPDEIPYFQPHEHVMLESGYAAQLNAELCIDDISLTINELKKLPTGSALVDAQPIGAGRMANELVKVSQETGIHLVASTGFHKSNFYWPDHWIHTSNAEFLVDVFISEIQKGMYLGNRTEKPIQSIDAKAGLIKTAVDKDGLTPYYRTKFEAAAEASLKTNVSIMVHVEVGSDPFEIIHFLTKRKVNPEKIILCHLDRTHHDYKLHEEVASSGVHLEYDTIGRFKYHDDNKELKLIQHMLESGLQGSLLLSLDTTRARLGTYGGTIGIDYLTQTFIPQMKANGINEDVINTITQHNPLKALSIITK